MKQTRWIPRIIAFLIIGSLLCTASLSYAEPIKKDQEFFDAVKEYIENNYALEVKEQDLYDEAIKGMFNALDPYSEYLSREDYKALKENTSGVYFGIGAVIGKEENGNFVISGVIKGTPAEKVGLKKGDIIIAVNQKPLPPTSTTEKLVKEIKGPEGTTVQISVLRNKEKKDFTVTRKRIQLVSVEEKMLDAGIGYLKISEFQDNTYRDVTKAIQSLKSKGATKLVLDLRDNPGGLLRGVIEVADYFVPKGKLLEVRYRNSLAEIYHSKGALEFRQVVVLVNEATASAAEILSGAMKDTKAALLIGKKTYGKGVVQDIYELKNGEAIKITVAKYILPSGSDINEKGIMPDLEMQTPLPDTDKDPWVDKAVQLLKK